MEPPKSASKLSNLETAHSQLADAEEIFGLLVDAVKDYAIFAMTLDGTILTWNAGAERLKGYQAAEVIGKNFRCFYTPPDIERDHPSFELKQALSLGKYEEEGWRLRKNGSQFWANVVITPMYNKTGKLLGFSKVTRDLTERKKAADQLHRAYADMETQVVARTQEMYQAKLRAEKAVKAREEFFSIASHELKTPLASLKLQTQIRKRCVAKGDFSDFAPERLAELCADDEKQIQRLSNLVENMLDISRLTSGNFKLSTETFDLVDLLKDLIKRMSPLLAQSGNDCTLQSPTHVLGNWDRLRLEQVFTNLLSNAGKYAPGKPIEILCENDDSMVTIRIVDQGPGISATDIARAFQPFERLDNNTKVAGLGLGLYITKQIVEAHGGQIGIEDRDPGKSQTGTVFKVELPIQGPSPEIPQESKNE